MIAGRVYSPYEVEVIQGVFWGLSDALRVAKDRLEAHGEHEAIATIDSAIESAVVETDLALLDRTLEDSASGGDSDEPAD